MPLRHSTQLARKYKGFGSEMDRLKKIWHVWKAFGQFIGDLLARVVLTLFYFTVFVPFGLGVKLFSDPLQLKNAPAEFWRPRSTGDQTLEDVLRQY